MASVIGQFLGLIGLDIYPPTTMVELIPYLLELLVGVVLVSGVFRVIGKIAEAFINSVRRW